MAKNVTSISQAMPMVAPNIDSNEIIATLRAATDIFGDMFERAEELEAFLETSAALAGKQQLDPARAFLFARTGARLAHALMIDLDAAFERFALEADRYEQRGTASLGEPT
ncbi:hypothetical protein [Burkholderia cenocepacia]|uniref:hypothetical protein n=1 Tax=Burkholderia cenocepacia TaxID=95486 RepID=UPI000679E1C7|nr:hypothetical protein [Burkholderia cenocepacia]KWU25852.1 hypothetical protein AS149_27605 [Burkholderia cenocepacia]